MHYNEIKSLIKDLFSVLKAQKPFADAIETAIEAIVGPIDISHIKSCPKMISGKEQLKKHIKDELIYEVNVSQDTEPGNFHSLVDKDGHIPWYRESKDAIEFRFWNRYKKYLRNIKAWPDTTLGKLDEVTDAIIEQLENPKVRSRAFDRRGLVVGYVQSGKTANFMGLINKSIDAGYRFIVVLSGIHNNLRTQTQMRIDEEVIGRDTSVRAEVKRVGVTTLPGEKYLHVDVFTTQEQDFNIKIARQVGVQPSTERPMIFIIKKNVSVLKNLIKYIKESIDTLPNDYVVHEKKMINNLPLLLIDDEADQASPDTRNTDDNPELDPTAINRLIRSLLNQFCQKAYVGYTATPFANIFINHSKNHDEYGKDLFPSSFVISLDPPSNYFGPLEVFGITGANDKNGLPIFREVRDAAQRESEFLPLKHKSLDVPRFIPESMKNAIKSFVISSAVRILRGQEKQHNTMLIHCTRYNSIQTGIGILVEDYFGKFRNRLINDDPTVINELENLWNSDYEPVFDKMGSSIVEWEDVKRVVKKAVSKIRARPLVVNGSAKDLLDYKDHESDGLSVIAIGGDKLSRGLTLEGLTVSYFTRASTLYDALMQMGRWFGYRMNYEDLCRIYTTQEMYGWYRHISTAFQKLREEIFEMISQGATPDQFGLRVLSHPDMMVTNALKMRSSARMPLTYRGKITQTISFSKSDITHNSNVFKSFILSLGKSSDSGSSYLWKDIEVHRVLELFKDIRTCKFSPSSSSSRIVEYITSHGNRQILEKWNVALVSLRRDSTKSDSRTIGNLVVKPVERGLKGQLWEDRFYIGVLTSPQDEFIDFDDRENLNRTNLRGVEPRKSRPLLLIYPLNLKDDKDAIVNDNIMGFAIVWPDNESLMEITYEVNSVYTEMELAAYD